MKKVAIGTAALMRDKSTTLSNTAIGFAALINNLSGNGNVAVGYSAGSGAANNQASRNTLIGYQAATSVNLASGVTAVGFMAARSAFNGSNIIAIGDSALFANLSANNMAVGSQALRNLTGGSSNTALGKRAMYNAVSNSQNVAVGHSALDSLSSGNFNTAIGYNTGFFNSGNQHTLVGAGANILTNGIANATAIGSFSAATQSNTLILGSIAGVNGSPTSASVGIGTTTPTARLDVANTFKLGSVGSINNSMIRANVVIDVGSIAANSELDVLVTIANISAFTAVSVSPSADIEAGVSIEWARVSAANTVKIRFRNNTGLAIDPASQTYHFLIVQ
ncbi:MAG: hypothetical protein IPP48_04490 [Chitinophagaceae bacterium]|nr:hypothetical protein [Chitinophagaceae bacterium]